MQKVLGKDYHPVLLLMSLETNQLHFDSAAQMKQFCHKENVWLCKFYHLFHSSTTNTIESLK